MFVPEYEKVVQFASEGDLAEEIGRARGEFIERTGDLFESDESYERRLSIFLEWYVLDRPVSFASTRTPAKIFIESVQAERTTQNLTSLRNLTKTRLSLFEFKKSKGETMRIVDILSGEKLNVFERRKPVGLEPGDIFEGRLIPREEHLMLASGAVTIHPREVRKQILKAAKAHREQDDEDLDMVHRVAFLTNRCERYGHLSPSAIFAEMH